MRRLSPGFRARLLAESMDDDAVALVTIEHTGLDDALRISSHPTECLSIDPLLYGTTSRGEVYDYIPFQFAAPEDTEGKPPGMEIHLPNIGREVVDLLQSTSEPALVTLELVSRQTPDLVEVEFFQFDLVTGEHGDDDVVITLGIDALASEPYPCDSFLPATFRGLF